MSTQILNWIAMKLNWSSSNLTPNFEHLAIFEADSLKFLLCTAVRRLHF